MRTLFISILAITLSVNISCTKSKDKSYLKKIEGTWEISSIKPAFKTFDKITFKNCGTPNTLCEAYGSYIDEFNIVHNIDFNYSINDGYLTNDHQNYNYANNNVAFVTFPNELLIVNAKKETMQMSFKGGELTLIKIK